MKASHFILLAMVIELAMIPISTWAMALQRAVLAALLFGLWLALRHLEEDEQQ